MLAAVLLLALSAPLSMTAAAPSTLAAAASAAGRPAECRASARSFGHGPSVWERARTPSLERYCDLVARAQAELVSRPEDAKKSAEAAEAALPGKAAPKVLRARAMLALGMPSEAAATFAEALAIEPRCVEDPAALHAYARTLLRTGKSDAALTSYRALVPRAEFLGGSGERALALIEAADLSMSVAGAHDPAKPAARPGASGLATTGDARSRELDEAIAYLREARLRATTELAADATLLLALALDRAGDHAGADAALADAHRAGAHPHTLAYLAAPEDLLALEALGLEGSDRGAAQKKWDVFLAGPGGRGPWAAAARARAEGAKRGGAKASEAPRPSRRSP